MSGRNGGFSLGSDGIMRDAPLGISARMARLHCEAPIEMRALMKIAQARLDETEEDAAEDFKECLNLCTQLCANRRPGLRQLLSGAVAMLGSTTAPEVSIISVQPEVTTTVVNSDGPTAKRKRTAQREGVKKDCNGVFRLPETVPGAKEILETLTEEHQRRNSKEGWKKVCDVPRPIRTILDIYKVYPGDVWHGPWCKPECPGEKPVSESEMDVAELP